MNSMRVERMGDATLYLGDCMKVLPTLEKVDAVVTDPPYSERTHRGHAATSNGHAGFGSDTSVRKDLGYGALSLEVVAQLAAEFDRVCKGWIVWMCDHHLAIPIQDALEERNRYVFAPLPYFAPGSRTRLGGDGPASWTIWIMVSRTAKQRRWGTLPGGYVAGPGWREREHMGGKPVKLMDRIVGDYSRSEQTILDPFMGSGTTGVACANLGRKFIGVEIEERYFDIACERIEAAYAQGRLFEEPEVKPEAKELFA